MEVTTPPIDVEAGVNPTCLYTMLASGIQVCADVAASDITPDTPQPTSPYSTQREHSDDVSNTNLQHKWNIKPGDSVSITKNWSGPGGKYFLARISEKM